MGNLSPDDLKKLGKLLKGARGDLAKKLGKLAKARLIDLSLCKECENAGECACEGVCSAIGVKKLLSKRGGRGGLTEGPGHNELSWTDGTKEEGAKFKEIALPPGSLSDLKDSIKVGVAKTQPKEGDAVASQGGAIQNAATGGGGANATVILPQHRATVQRFFARPKE
jgi:hypothetical protein